MECANCGGHAPKNVGSCPECGEVMKGGVLFVTGISGSGVREYIDRVLNEGEKHGHTLIRHDIGNIMRKRAEVNQLNVRWDYILDADDTALRLLRALAFDQVAHQIEMNPESLHLVDLHLTFRWRAYLTKGFEPHVLEPFRAHARLFVNIIEDVAKIRERLSKTAWAEKKIQELLLLVWRDEELLLTDFFAGICGLERSYAVAAGEPPLVLEQLIWHPEYKKVYLSFPMTNLVADPEAREEIRAFRDRIREFLVVFDPDACKDYAETYVRPEMKALREEIGDVTEERDYRFINQADAIVVYFPQIVPSKGVDAEMRHAKRSGKTIFMYQPENGIDVGPFAVIPDFLCHDQDEFVELLRRELASEIS